MQTMTLARTAVGVAVAFSIAGCGQQRTGLDAVAEAMGATTLNSVQFSGSGSVFGFGQAYIPGERWPRFSQRTYRASASYQTPGMRLEQVRAQFEAPPRGGAAQPVAGEQTTIQVVSGQHAWSEGGREPVPNPTTVDDRLRQLWATPHGVIKAAIANGGRLEGNVVTVTVQGRALTATLNEQNLVERVRYLSTNPVVGDYPIEITYSDYARFGAVQFPTHIVETQDGHPTLDITIQDVTPNAAVALDVPPAVQGAPAPPATPTVTMEKLAEGVWYVAAAGIRSWAVEFRDHIVVVEGPTSEARSLAVNGAIAKQVPNKPIRYLVNTHAHYDHAGGVRTYVAQGATIVTHDTNKAFFEQVWARPRTIEPDLLSQSPKPPVFETMTDTKVMSDGARRLELYHVKDSGHNVGMIIAYLPRERLIFWGDGYNPPAGDDPRDPARTPEYGIDLYRNITERKLNVERLAPARRRRARPFSNLAKAIGLISAR
jgi:glyoxylase-like metal-dependent hydrolase (beta-lactamase superfamily II)